MAREILWRDTGITPKIFILDARAVFPLALWLFHWTYWTAAIAFTGITVLYLVQRTGMSPLACARAIRVAFMGSRRETRSNEIQWRKRCRWCVCAQPPCKKPCLWAWARWRLFWA